MNDPLGGALCKILQGDALAVLPTLPAGCVNFSMTSPPYWKLRDYQTGKWEGGDPACSHRQGKTRRDANLAFPTAGPDRRGNFPQAEQSYRDVCGKCGARRIDQQIGMEAVHDCNGWATGSRCGGCYICRLLAVFAEVRRVLRDDGVLVVNLSDSYANNGHEAPIQIASNTLGKEPHHKSIHRPQPGKAIPAGLDSGSLLGIPWRFALAMQQTGWCLRSSVCWAKLAPMPESVQGWRWERCRKKVKSAPHEHPGFRTGRLKKYGVTLSDSENAEYEPCPGCKKCRDTDGYVLRKGSWRPTRSHEQVFVFTKGGAYWCDGDAVRTPIAETVKEHHARYHVEDRSYNNKQHQAVGDNLSKHARPLHPLGANLRDVLWLGPEPGKQAVILRALPECPVHKGIMPYRHGQTEGPIYVEVMPKSWNKCECKARHFAAFPSSLCKPFLEAFCPQRCCAECGTGWVRVVETERGGPTSRESRRPTPTGVTGNHNSMGKVNGSDTRGLPSVRIETLGWRPACNCQSQAEPVAGLCLDPFSGTGTLALTARRMGLRVLGVELSEGYCTLSRCRLQVDQPLFNGLVPEETT